jgi:hypothetical protein
MIVTVQVGFTVSRPVVPDEHFAYVNVIGDTEIECSLIATQIVACTPRLGQSVQMPTSSKIIDMQEI